MKFLSFIESKKQFLLLVLILTLSSVVTDLYVPSFLEMPLKLDTSMNGVQWSLSLFVLMLSLSHLFYGALAESFGSKKILLFGLGLAFIGSLLCVAAVSIEDLLVGRALQGLGIGAAAVLWRDMARISQRPSETLKDSPYLGPMSIMVIILAPFLGGIIQTYLGWRANFAYLLFHVGLVFIAVYFLFQDEKEKPEETSQRQFSKKAYKELLSNRLFLAYSFCSFLCYGAFFTWTGSGPVVLLQVMEITPYELGLAMVLTALPMGFGGGLHSYLVETSHEKLLLRASLGVMVFSSLVLVLSPKILTEVSLWHILAPICLFMFASGVFWPCVYRSVIKSFHHLGSVASSLYGFFQLLGAGCFGIFFSYITKETQTSIGATMLFGLVCCALVYELLIARKPH